MDETTISFCLMKMGRSFEEALIACLIYDKGIDYVREFVKKTGMSDSDKDDTIIYLEELWDETKAVIHSQEPIE